MSNRTGQYRILLAVGEKLLITPYQGGNTADSRQRSTVVDIVAVRSRSVDITGLPDMDSSVAGGAIVDATLMRSSGVYSFRCRIPKQRRRGVGQNPSTITLALPSDAERIQRRGDYRLPLSIRSQIKIGPHEDWLPVWMENLSGGGALLNCQSPAPIGSEISVAVPMGVDGELSHVRAVVIECAPQDESTRSNLPSFLLRLSFDNGGSVHLSETEREEIVRYIFQQERVMLRVRKLMRSSDSGDNSSAGQKKTRALAGLLAWMRAPSLGWKL